MGKKSKRKNVNLGAVLIMFTVLFSHEITKHFGYNWLPQTKSELFCDIATIILFAFSWYLLHKD